MIMLDGDDFTGEIADRWVGKEVTVSKTNPAPVLRMTIQSARMAGWEDMPRQIQDKHGRDTGFLVVAGPVGGGDGEERRESRDQSLVIPVDRETAYDVRNHRLVVLTGREVVQFSLGMQ